MKTGADPLNALRVLGLVGCGIKAPNSEKAQINIQGAEPLYQEVRIENKLTDEDGNEVKLKEGAKVEVHVEANKSATTPTNPKRD